MGYSKKKLVLDNVSLEIESGEFFVLLGPSGCGKTTILRLISGISKPQEGDILFDGVSVKDKEAQERNVAMVFQNFALYPHLSVYKNIAYPLESRKMPKAEIDEKVREIAAAFGITDLLDRKPRVLSGGQRQLAAIARAMVRRPAVFLLDEPFSNLDVELRDTLRMQVRKAHRLMPETTFVYVTHDQNEAMSLSDRMAIMKDGKIMACGSTAEIYLHPDSEYAAQFLGSPRINLIPADARTENGENWIAAVGGQSVAIPELSRTASSEGASVPVHLGIRPEQLFTELPEENTGEFVPVHGIFQGLARAGTGVQALFRIPGTEETFSSTAAGTVPERAGEEIIFYVKKNNIQVYDAQSGRSIKRRF